MLLKCRKWLKRPFFNSLQVLSADLHGSPVQAAKVFSDKENEFAHNVLKSAAQTYQIFQVPLQLKQPVAAEITVPSLGSESLYDQFSALTNYCVQQQVLLSEARFAEFIKVFCNNTHKLSDEQLLDCLRQISRLPEEESVRAANFVELWNTLDVECCCRLEKWTSAQILMVCDAWYHLNLVRISDFVGEALRKLGRKVRRLPKEQMVQAMFLCNLVRRPIYDMHDFELNLEKCMDQLSLQELSVMAMGFFKTQTPIRNPVLIEQLYRRLLAQLDTVEDIALVALLKILRYSSKLPQVNLLLELLDALKGQLERLSLLSCLHIALLGSDIQCCDDEVLARILARFERELKQTRLKDLERICLIIGIFNVKTADGVEQRLCGKILESLNERIPEILQHPRPFATCLHYLAIRGFYDMEMLTSALDMAFLRHAYGKNLALGREIFSLDSFVKINLKQSGYAGNQLLDKYRATMGKLLTHYIPERNPKYKLGITDRVLLESKETTENIFSVANFKHILPHFERPDILICYDRAARNTIPLSEDCPKDYSGVILTRDLILGEHESSNIDTVAIVVVGWNNVVRDKNRYTGLFESKLKQLELLGHKYILIQWFEWRELETQADRIKFIKRRLAEVIPL